MLRRFAISCTAFLALVMLPALASAQFGGLVGGKKSKFDSKRVDSAVKRIDEIKSQYEEGTVKVWTSVETLQGLVEQYSSGDFPILSNNWASLKQIAQEKIKERADKLKEAGKTDELLELEELTLFELRDHYIKEVTDRKKKVEEVLTDPVRSSDFTNGLQAPEWEKLKAIKKDIPAVADKDAALVKEATNVMADIASIIKDLGVQMTQDPLKVNDYKKMVSKLEKGNKKLEQIVGELDKQVKAITDLTDTVGKLLDKATN